MTQRLTVCSEKHLRLARHDKAYQHLAISVHADLVLVRGYGKRSLKVMITFILEGIAQTGDEGKGVQGAMEFCLIRFLCFSLQVTPMDESDR